MRHNRPSGPYLDDPKVAKEFTDAYMEMVAGFLTFPLKFPGTAVWRAMKVRLCAACCCCMIVVCSSSSYVSCTKPWVQQTA
jgi:hypothetical protein